MFSISLSTLFLFPFLALISVPLLISACITICFSVLALSLRVFVVYLKLLYSVITNFSAFPISSSSLLNLSASGSGTPSISRTRGVKQGPLSSDILLHPSDDFYYRLQAPLNRRTGHKLQEESDPLISEDDIVRDYHRQISSNTKRQSYHPSVTLSPGGFLGLTTGDENRDFEGLGGWRSLPSTAASHGINDDTDERAWLSINHRLELPSRLPSMGSSTSDASIMDIFDDTGTPKHYKRSVTNPTLMDDHNTGVKVPSANMQSPSNSTSSVIHRPQFSSPNTVPGVLSASMSRASSTTTASFPKPNISKTRGHLTSSPEVHSGDGYFALRRPRSSSRTSNTGGSTTPRGAEERPNMNIGLSISHYPSSPGRRRQSSLNSSSGSPNLRTTAPASGLFSGRPEVHDDFHSW